MKRFLFLIVFALIYTAVEDALVAAAPGEPVLAFKAIAQVIGAALNWAIMAFVLRKLPDAKMVNRERRRRSRVTSHASDDVESHRQKPTQDNIPSSDYIPTGDTHAT